jgi:hypothetical protein
MFSHGAGRATVNLTLFVNECLKEMFSHGADKETVNLEIIMLQTPLNHSSIVPLFLADKTCNLVIGIR